MEEACKSIGACALEGPRKTTRGGEWEPIKISSEMAIVPNNPPNPKTHKCDDLKPTSDWMPFGMPREHSGTLTTAKNQEPAETLRNLKIKLSTSIKMKQETNAKSPKPTGGLMT